MAQWQLPRGLLPAAHLLAKQNLMMMPPCPNVISSSCLAHWPHKQDPAAITTLQLLESTQALEMTACQLAPWAWAWKMHALDGQQADTNLTSSAMLVHHMRGRGLVQILGKMHHQRVW